MPTREAIVLVAGATGQQGGAAAARLLADGWRVRALTRDPTSAAATALRDAGAEIVAGDMGDRGSLDAALRGVHGVFSVQPPGLDEHFAPADEIRLGKSLLDGAKAAGIGHFVYSSVGGADRQSGIPHFESKWAIEQHVRASGLAFTILRPVSFMELLLSPFVSLESSTLSFLLRPDTPMHWIAVDDIGAFVAMAFDRPGAFTGRALEITGDTASMADVARAVSAATGQPIAYAPYPQSVIAANPVLLAIQAFAEGRGFAADIPALRKLHPDLSSLTTWLDRKGSKLFEAKLALRPLSGPEAPADAVAR
jgi:uncharacterized protein YbjT (DUF2867 family)